MASFLAEHLVPELGLLAGAIYVAALITAIDALMTNRTAQGAIAWAVSLITLPMAALPLYLIFGRSRFNGYVAARRSNNRDLKSIRSKTIHPKPRISMGPSSRPVGKKAIIIAAPIFWFASPPVGPAWKPIALEVSVSDPSLKLSSSKGLRLRLGCCARIFM